MKHILSLFLIGTLLLSGCTTTPEEAAGEGDTTPAEVSFAESDSEMFTDRDLDGTYSQSGSVSVQLNGDSATATGSGVSISGSTVTVTGEGTYIFSGALTNGQIIVNAPETAKPQLVLNGTSIHSESGAALYILNADKVFLTLAPDTENTLTNGGTFTATDENNVDAAVFSKSDLTLNGYGKLAVTSPAGHGIACKDDLAVTGGTYTIQSAFHGIDANDSVRVKNATLTVDAGKDGLHAENTEDTTRGFQYLAGGTYTIEAEGDGVSASAHLQITDGTFDILTGGGHVNGQKQSSDSWGGFMGGGRPGQSSSTTTEENSTSIKGLKSTGSMQITGGTFTIDSADDAVHANASVTVKGGTFDIASGDDGFHADETLSISAGTIRVTNSYEGLEALDIAVSGGDISLVASDDGLNAAGGTDQSGFGGDRGGDQFGRPGGGMGGPGGGMGGPGGGGPGGGMSSGGNGSIVISGGTLYVNASGDGLDANGTLAISGGHVTVCGPTQGDTATLDYDTSATITGGTFLGTGAAGMAQTFSDAEQGVIALSVGNQAAGTLITLTDADGNTVLTHTPELSFAVVILSSPDIVSGETYTITVGNNSGTFEAG